MICLINTGVSFQENSGGLCLSSVIVHHPRGRISCKSMRAYSKQDDSQTASDQSAIDRLYILPVNGFALNRSKIGIHDLLVKCFPSTSFKHSKNCSEILTS